MAELAIYENITENENRYLVFSVKNEKFAFDISNVNNIVQMEKIRPVPCAPKCYKGVINLRGDIIPVMSLHTKFNLGDDNITSNSKIIILNVDENKQVGVIVDNVKEVLTISNDEIEKPSPFLKKEESNVTGVSKVKDSLISIIEVNSIM